MVYVSKLVPVKTGNKGSILIAFLFIIILTITTASYFIMIGGRSAFTANQLKRAQAINCAEAALYEAFNRFRVGPPTGWDPASPPVGSGIWDNDAIQIKVADPTNPTTTYDVDVDIMISNATAPHEINARVHYDDIRM